MKPPELIRPSLGWLILLLVLPAMLIGWMWVSIHRAERRVIREETRRGLEEEFKLFQRTLNPEFQLAQLLTAELHQAWFGNGTSRLIPRSRDGGTAWDRVIRRLRRLDASVLPFSWWVVRRPPRESDERGQPDSFGMFSLMATRAQENEFASDEAVPLLTYMCRWLAEDGIWTRAWESWRKNVMADLVGEYYIGMRFDLIVKRAFGRFESIRSGKFSARKIFWLPLLRPDWDQSSSGLPLRFDRGDWPLDRLRAGLLGGLLLCVRPEVLTADNGMRALRQNLRRRGMRLVVTDPRGRVHPRWSDPRWARHPAIRSLAKSRRSWDEGETWMAVKGQFLLDAQYIGVLVADLPGSRASHPRTPWLGGGSGVFLLALLLVLGEGIVLGRRVRVSLRTQVSAGFCMALFPGLLIGGLLLEQAAIERRVRELAAVERHLEAHLARRDESHGLQIVRLGAVADRVLRDRLVWDGMKDRARTAPELTKIPGSRQVDPLIFQVYWRALCMGFDLRSLYFFGHGLPALGAVTAGEMMRDTSLFTRFLQFVATNAFANLRPSGEPSGPARFKGADLIFGAEFERIRDGFLTFLSPTAMGEMFLSPMAVNEMMGMGDNVTLVHRYLRDETGFGFLGQVYSRFLGPAMHGLLEWDRTPLPTELRWAQVGLVDQRAPFMRLVPPFVRTGILWQNQGTVGKEKPFLGAIPPFGWGTFLSSVATGSADFLTFYVDSREATEPQNQTWTEQVALAVESQEPIRRRVGAGSHQSVRWAVPGQATERFLLTGEVPLGPPLEWLSRARRSAWLLLTGLLLATVLLARRVSRRFLAPVHALQRAARAVAAGNFHQRLDESGGGEFARLATAFNLMVAGVAEGRLLRRFVSDSVHATARRRDREQAALEGEALEVVVLFVRLKGFHEQLRGETPVGVVRVLNTYLEGMSRIIRENGGDIDKFMGDKILAVFFPERVGSLEASVAAALGVADRLRQQWAAQPELSATPLSVGIVTGPVLAGILGTEEVQREYTVIGDTVNLASRLCDLAAQLPTGGIVIEGATETFAHALGGPEFSNRVQRLPVRSVKGKSREVTVSLIT
jgi:class 3 adenylate cyclase